MGDGVLEFSSPCTQQESDEMKIFNSSISNPSIRPSHSPAEEQNVNSTHDLEQSGLSSNSLRSPGKVTRVQSQSPVLGVSTSSSDLVDSLGRVKLGHGGLTTELKLSLLSAGALGVFQGQVGNSLVSPSSTRGGALVARVSCDTHSGG